jgi:hypothetical protein
VRALNRRDFCVSVKTMHGQSSNGWPGGSRASAVASRRSRRLSVVV